MLYRLAGRRLAWAWDDEECTRGVGVGMTTGGEDEPLGPKYPNDALSGAARGALLLPVLPEW